MLKNLGVVSYILSREITNELFESKSVSNNQNNFIDFSVILSESEILSKEYLVYKNIEAKYIKDDYLASRYIDENISLFSNVRYADYVNENKKLDIFTVKENSVPNEKIELYEAIQNLITETTIKKGIKSVDKIHDSFEKILTHIKNNKPNEITETISFDIEPEYLDNLYNKSVELFNKKYNNLNEFEIKIINSFDINENKEKLFNELIAESKNKVKQLKESTTDTDVLLTINLVSEKLEKYSFNEETYLEDILKISDLYYCL